MSRSRRIGLSAVVALCAGTLSVLYVTGQLGGSNEHTRAQAQARKPAAPQTSPGVAKRRPPGSLATTAHGSASRPQAASPHAPARTTRHPSRALPWRPDGISFVAHTRGRRLAVYSRPRVHHPAFVLRNPDRIGTPRVVLVRSSQAKWVHVYLPTRPNGRTGWVRRRAVTLLRNPYRVVVRLRRHRLEVWRGRRRVLVAQTVVGKPSTPTPRGMFYVVDLLRPSSPYGAYGAYAFGLSAHSDVLKTFAGGDGRVAIHGTNQPWLLGQSVSHGCIRVSNRVIRRLAHVLPLGTPVLVR